MAHAETELTLSKPEGGVALEWEGVKGTAESVIASKKFWPRSTCDRHVGRIANSRRNGLSSQAAPPSVDSFEKQA